MSYSESYVGLKRTNKVGVVMVVLVGDNMGKISETRNDASFLF